MHKYPDTPWRTVLYEYTENMSFLRTATLALMALFVAGGTWVLGTIKTSATTQAKTESDAHVASAQNLSCSVQNDDDVTFVSCGGFF